MQYFRGCCLSRVFIRVGDVFLSSLNRHCFSYVATRMSSNRGTKVFFFFLCKKIPLLVNSLIFCLQTPAQGAEAPVWLATAPLDTLASGQFFTDVKTEHKL
jgi:hypothetical protein